MTKVILVCGGRDFNDYKRVCEVLDSLEFDRIIHGGARGADMLGDRYAKEKGIERIVYPANWSGLGKRAGYVRNALMLSHGDPDVVVAFPGGRGTKMMKELAEKAGKEVIDG